MLSPNGGRSWSWAGHTQFAFPNPSGFAMTAAEGEGKYSHLRDELGSQGFREMRSLPNRTHLKCAELEPEPRLQTPVLTPMAEIGANASPSSNYQSSFPSDFSKPDSSASKDKPTLLGSYCHASC